MILNVLAFSEKIKAKEFPPVILFGPGKPPWGKEDYEPYLVDQALETLIAACVDPSLRDLAYSVYYADETAPGTVVEEARTVPFLAERRVVLVRNADVYMNMASDKRSPIQPLLQFIENPPESSLLILVSTTVNKIKPLYKLTEKNGVMVECPQLGDKEYAAWIQDEIARNGNKITRSALTMLIDRVGARMADMHNAINLICNFAGTGKEITEASVLAASGDVAETTVWALTDAIATSDPTKALECLHELLSMNMSPDEILGTLNWLLESTYRAHPQTPMKLGKPFVERKVAPLTKKFAPKRIAAALGMCTKTNFALRTTGTDAHLLLEMLIIKLAYSKK